MQESVKPKLGFGSLKAKNRKMSNIQKLIKEITSAKLRQAKYARKAAQIDDTVMICMHKGQVLAFNFTLRKLKLLLKEETAKDLPECICHLGGIAPSKCAAH